MYKERKDWLERIKLNKLKIGHGFIFPDCETIFLKLLTHRKIKDSQSFLQKTKDIVFTKKRYLYSLDIVSLCTNMRSNDVINRISNYFKKLTIMFSTNVFKVGSKFYKQINGLPM